LNAKEVVSIDGGNLKRRLLKAIAEYIIENQSGNHLPGANGYMGSKL